MWFRVDDAFLRHPKVHAAADTLGGRNAVGRIAAVWLECGLYASGVLTDGFVPDREIGRLITDEKPHDVVNALVSAGMLRRTTGGVTFHDWLDWNPSAAKVKEKRAKDRERKSGGHGANGRNGFHEESRSDSESESVGNPDGRRNGNGVESGVIPARSRARDPVPSRPVPEDQAQPPARRARFERFWEAYPRKEAPGSAERVFRKLDPDDGLLEQMLVAIEQQQRTHQWRKDAGAFIPKPANWLADRCWQNELVGSPASAAVAADVMDLCERAGLRGHDIGTWFPGVRCVSNGVGYTLEVPDPDRARWIEKHYGEQLAAAAETLIEIRVAA
jgi:hypothetical protein